MGILNVTPDSFSDGGRFLAHETAVAHGLQLVREGAQIVDVGGESTRPGAEPVGEQEELRRVIPVIERLAASGTGAQISIDTSKACVARAALEAGATLVNDVTALRGDPGMAEVVAQGQADCCLMHMLGEPRNMQADPRYADVVDEVRDFLEERLAFAVAVGIPQSRVLLDPGIGFGKTVRHNLQLLSRLGELVAIGPAVLVGSSRKSFLGRLAAPGARVSGSAQALPASAHARSGAAGDETSERLPGTIATNVMALERGARVFRVHDVAPVAAALRVAAATLSAT